MSDLRKISNIESRIYTLRGVQVMLDRDLAHLYDVETRALKQAVKRNIVRFPADFMFELTEGEVDRLVSQSVIPSKKQLGGALPYAFTEQGVAGISSILTSERAVAVNISIMRAFVEMRRFMSTNAQIFQRLDTLEIKQFATDKKVEQVLNAIEDKSIKAKQGIFFDGQIFDAYVFVSKLIRSAKNRIILIDNYVDESALTLLSKRKKQVSAQILTKTISKQLALDLEKFNQQYPAINVETFELAHDCFLIIDDKIYHIGASLKDLGKKWFAFSKMEMSVVSMLAKVKI